MHAGVLGLGHGGESRLRGNAEARGYDAQDERKKFATQHDSFSDLQQEAKFHGSYGSALHHLRGLIRVTV